MELWVPFFKYWHGIMTPFFPQNGTSLSLYPQRYPSWYDFIMLHIISLYCRYSMCSFSCIYLSNDKWFCFFDLKWIYYVFCVWKFRWIFRVLNWYLFLCRGKAVMFRCVHFSVRIQQGKKTSSNNIINTIANFAARNSIFNEHSISRINVL